MSVDAVGGSFRANFAGALGNLWRKTAHSQRGILHPADSLRDAFAPINTALFMLRSAGYLSQDPTASLQRLQPLGHLYFGRIGSYNRFIQTGRVGRFPRIRSPFDTQRTGRQADRSIGRLRYTGVRRCKKLSSESRHQESNTYKMDGNADAT
jgi:hypothetical protein